MTSSKILKIAQLWPSSEPQGRGREPLWLFWVKWCISRRNSWTGRGAIHNVIADFVMLSLSKDSTLHCASALYFEKKGKNKTNLLQNRNNNVWRNVVNMKMFKIQMYATHERQIILNFRRNSTLDTSLNMYLIFLCILTGLRSVDLKGANVATSRKTRNNAETLFFLTPITVCLVSLSCWNLHTI